MPKDARYKVRGGDLNEFDFHQRQEELVTKGTKNKKGTKAKKGATTKKGSARKSAKK